MAVSLLSGLSTTNLVIIFLLLFGSSLGLPIGIVTLVATSSLVKSYFYLFLIILVGFIAASLGDIIAYEIARKFSDSFLVFLRKFIFFRKYEVRARNLLNEYGFYIVFFSRFLFVSICSPVSYICGLEKLNRKKYIAAVITGEFLYASIYALIGFFIGEVLNNFISIFNDIVVIIISIVIFFYIIKFILRCPKCSFRTLSILMDRKRRHFGAQQKIL